MQKFFVEGKQLLLRQKLWDFLSLLFFFLHVDRMRYAFLNIGLSSSVIDFDVVLRSQETKVDTHVAGRERTRLPFVSLSPALVRFFFNICPIPLFDRSAETRRVE